MRKHTRWLIILTATIVLPSLMLFQPGEAKRGDKKKSSTTSRMAGRASLLRNGGAIITPQSASLTPVSMQAVGFAISPATRDMTPEEIKKDPVVEPELKEKPINRQSGLRHVQADQLRYGRSLPGTCTGRSLSTNRRQHHHSKIGAICSPQQKRHWRKPVPLLVIRSASTRSECNLVTNICECVPCCHA